METIKFHNLLEDSFRLYEYCKQNELTTFEDFEDWYQAGEDLRFFEGDPDMVKVDGSIGYFYRAENEVFVYIDILDFDDVEAVLNRFYNNELETTDPQSWEQWEKLQNGVAFRGGAGYVYNIYKA